MKKYTSQDAFYDKMKNLANINPKTPIVESAKDSLGTMINYKKAINGIAYGIIKENHNYYIKIAGLKENPDISDFTYIGGLGNITDFQYKTLSEADKNRNMIFNTITEAHTPNVLKSKRVLLKEEKDAEDEIDKASSMVDDLEAKTDAAKETSEKDVDFASDAILSTPSTDGKEEELDNTEIETGEEEISDAETETPEDGAGLDAEDTGDDIDLDSLDDPTKDIEKLIGKVTNKIREIPEEEISTSDIKSFVNSFLSAFETLFPKLEIEEKKEMVKKILKPIDGDEMDELGTEIEASEKEIEENETCSECSSFAKYAESKGYDGESIMECDEEELGNLVSGYANAYNDGENDGDVEVVSKFISLLPKVLDILKSEYGHDEYAEELEPHIKSEDNLDKDELSNEINELFAGLKNLGKKAGETIGSAIKNTGEKVGQVAKGVKQAYYSGEKNAALNKLQTIATDLGKQINSVNKNAQKAGHEPINVGSILTTIKNQIVGSKSADLSKYRTAENVESDVVGEGKKEKPSAGLSKEKKSEIVKAAKKGEDIGKEGKGFKKVEKQAKKYGADNPKAVAAAAMWKNIKKEGEDKDDEDKESISEMKVRKYIRNRLEEKFGMKKTTLNESNKSEAIKKLDKLIDEQIKKIKSDL